LRGFKDIMVGGSSGIKSAMAQLAMLVRALARSRSLQQQRQNHSFWWIRSLQQQP